MAARRDLGAQRRRVQADGALHRAGGGRSHLDLTGMARHKGMARRDGPKGWPKGVAQRDVRKVRKGGGERAAPRARCEHSGAGREGGLRAKGRPARGAPPGHNRKRAHRTTCARRRLRAQLIAKRPHPTPPHTRTRAPPTTCSTSSQSSILSASASYFETSTASAPRGGGGGEGGDRGRRHTGWRWAHISGSERIIIIINHSCHAHVLVPRRVAPVPIRTTTRRPRSAAVHSTHVHMQQDALPCPANRVPWPRGPQPPAPARACRAPDTRKRKLACGSNGGSGRPAAGRRSA